MTELHWSIRSRLERLMLYTRPENKTERPEQETVAKSATPLDVINAIVDLVEHQRYRSAEHALTERSKHPKYMEGAIDAYDALLKHDLYPIQKLMQGPT